MKIKFIPKRDNCPLCGSKEIAFDFSLELDNSKINWDNCKICKLTFQNPRLDQEIIKNIYSGNMYWGTAQKENTGSLQAYSNYQSFDFIRLKQSRLRLKKIIAVSGIKGGKLLDVGCATGFFGFVAKECGFQVAGIEPSQEMAEFGRKKYGIDIQSSILEESVIEKESYDIITLWGTDSHFLNPLEGFTKLAQSLKPGGIIAMNYQNFRHWIRFLFPGLKKSWNSIYNLSDTSMIFLSKKLGLDLIYKKLEWQWVSIDHFFRITKLPVPKIARRGVIFLPAVSFSLAIMRKPLCKT